MKKSNNGQIWSITYLINFILIFLILALFGGPAPLIGNNFKDYRIVAIILLGLSISYLWLSIRRFILPGKNNVHDISLIIFACLLIGSSIYILLWCVK